MTEPCRRVRAPLPGPPLYVWVPVWKPAFGPLAKSGVERRPKPNPYLQRMVKR